MNVRNVVYLLLLLLITASCKENRLSKIPRIELMAFGPDAVQVNYDTATLQFRLQDGDADLGNSLNSGKYDIYVKDFRFDTGYAGYFFPQLDKSILDPNKGIEGTCRFYFTPYILLPRTDSIHMAEGDTTYFEVYIVDKAGNESNHIITSKVRMYF